MWQAVREILCNCMDEQGDHGVCDEVVTGEDGITKIIVTCPEFEQSYNTVVISCYFLKTVSW